MNIGQQVRFENRDVFNQQKIISKCHSYCKCCSSFYYDVSILPFVTLRNSGSIYGYISVDINPSVEFEIKETTGFWR